MTTDISIQKPKKVSSAINLLIVSIVLGVVNSIISEVTTEMKNYLSGMGLFITIFTFALMIFFIYQMNARKKWARTTFLVLFILGALMFPFTLITLFKSNIVVGLLTVILTVLQIIALTMIYSKESNEWFNLNKQTSP
jgi:FtsH-binding integral membrane protein